MNQLSLGARLRFLQVLWRVELLLLCLVSAGCSVPFQAEKKNTQNPELEAQVLQIIRDHPEVVIESLQAYQQKQEQKQQQQQSFLQQLQANPQAVIGASPTTGATESKVVLIEFSDFQCPYCAKAHETLKQFMAKHQRQVKLVYKHFPLTNIHPEAMPAAKAAWAASQQGKFWQYHDALFANQDKLGEEFYISTAKALNLDLEKFKRDRQSNAATAAIQTDIQLAENLGVKGTPFFVMNGVAFSGAVELSDLEKLLGNISK